MTRIARYEETIRSLIEFAVPMRINYRKVKQLSNPHTVYVFWPELPGYAFTGIGDTQGSAYRDAIAKIRAATGQ